MADQHYAVVTKDVMTAGRRYKVGDFITSHDLAERLIRFGKADPVGDTPANPPVPGAPAVPAASAEPVTSTAGKATLKES